MSEMASDPVVIAIFAFDFICFLFLAAFVRSEIELIALARENNKQVQAAAEQWKRLANFCDAHGVHPLDRFLKEMHGMKWKKALHDMGLEDHTHVVP
jgi:Mn-containing catalase